MKKGKSTKLNGYRSFKVTYGTVDSKNLKSIYINLQSWVEPKSNIERIDSTINNLSRKIKHTVLESLEKEVYEPKFIIDLDLRSSGIQMNKKSFMNLECYLYTKNHYDFKSPILKQSIKKIVDNIVSDVLLKSRYFDFTNSKKVLDTNYIES